MLFLLLGKVFLDVVALKLVDESDGVDILLHLDCLVDSDGTISFRSLDVKVAQALCVKIILSQLLFFFRLIGQGLL